MDAFTRRRALRAGVALSPLATLGCLERSDPPADEPAQAAADATGADAAGVVWSYDRGATAWTARDGVCYARENFDRGSGSVVALDAASGEASWRFGDPYAGQPFSEPAVRDGVYVGQRLEPHAGGVGRFHALELDGSVRWSEPVGHVFHRPVVSDGTLFVGTDAATAHAFDAADGGERWSTTLEADEREPVVVRVAGVNSEGVVVAVSDGTVRGLDPGTGAERWRHGDGTSSFDGTAVLVDGDVYAGSGRTVGRVADGRVTWQETFRGRAHLHGRAGDALVVTDDALVVALDVASGDRLWSERQGAEFAILVEGDRIHVGTTELRTLGPDGEPTRSVRLDGTPVEALATDGESVYASTRDGVHRIAPDGTVRSTSEVAAATSFAFGERTYVGTGDAVHALAL